MVVNTKCLIVIPNLNVTQFNLINQVHRPQLPEQIRSHNLCQVKIVIHLIVFFTFPFMLSHLPSTIKHQPSPINPHLPTEVKSRLSEHSIIQTFNHSFIIQPFNQSPNQTSIPLSIQSFNHSFNNHSIIHPFSHQSITQSNIYSLIHSIIQSFFQQSFNHSFIQQSVNQPIIKSNIYSSPIHFTCRSVTYAGGTFIHSIINQPIHSKSTINQTSIPPSIQSFFQQSFNHSIIQQSTNHSIIHPSSRHYSLSLLFILFPLPICCFIVTTILTTVNINVAISTSSLNNSSNIPKAGSCAYKIAPAFIAGTESIDRYFFIIKFH